MYCQTVFDSAYDRKDVPHSVDWQGLDTSRYDERWVWRLTLLYPKRVYEVLRGAQAKCPGCPLYRGTIIKPLDALRARLNESQYTPEKRQANIDGINEAAASAFSINGAQAQQQTSPARTHIALCDPRVAARAGRKGITLEKARREIEWQISNRVLIGAK